jgi:hypothetical protein
VTGTTRVTRPQERYVPLVYFAVALALVAVLLPSALRPPPPDTNQSAEFSPDAPPDENTDSIIASLGRAQSGTGSGDAIGGEGGIPTTTTLPLNAPGSPPAAGAPPRACPRGFGNPPRQIESVYSAPCAGPFNEDNGGATYKGVTANEIRVALIMCTNVMASKNGLIDENATDGNGRDKTLRAYQRYFNQNYQFYGRHLQIVSLNPKDGNTCNETANKAMVTEADDTYHSFGIMADIGYTYQEAVRRKMVVEAHWTAGQPDYYRRNFPYMFSPTLDADKLVDANVEFLCKQIVGKPAANTDDPNINGKPRKLGIVSWAGSDWGASGQVYQDALAKRCNAKFDAVETVDTFSESANSAQTWSSVVTKFKLEGITTILFGIDYVFGGQIANAASAQDYYPEWIVCGCFAWDTNIAMHFFVNSAQWRHAFGITAREVPRAQPETDWYRAYQSVEPSGDPDETVGLVVFNSLVHLANGIQMAGPNLTPETFMQGLFKVPARPPDPAWSIGGGFSPGDLTYPDYVGFIWWNPTDLAPDDSTGPGAYRHVYQGKKFRIGELPEEPIPFFKDGVTGLSGS